MVPVLSEFLVRNHPEHRYAFTDFDSQYRIILTLVVFQAKQERLTQTYEEEGAELCQLQEHFAVLELEYTQIMEERRRESERREEEKRKRATQSQAAVIIQAVWRGWKVRKAMKNKSKSKKSKKGKAKKAK